MRSLIVLFVLMTLPACAQFQRADSVGNFYVVKNQLIWQKYYPLEDKEYLDQQLKQHHFTSDLDISRFTTSTITKPYKLVGHNLPEYAQHDYKAFLIIDFFGDQYRITIKQITFPDFVEKIYWNGMRQHDSRGSLEQYILRQDGLIKRNNGTLNVLYTFDTAFSEIFDPMAGLDFE